PPPFVASRVTVVPEHISRDEALESTGTMQAVFRNTDTLDEGIGTPVLSSMLVMAISGFPSPSKSAVRTWRCRYVAGRNTDSLKEMLVPELVLLRTVTCFDKEPMARSGLPSPSKSAISTLTGKDAVV